ncbi:quinolinate synthetase complex, A subunit [Methanocaldococcus vulcanius M7]|uniref:Quinolinate synthase n=1 Tax=Methanocaldococcus vulcanius (strain ATCC 700851 / DSM 12094 / M7) TaxID=579137 RepID=C9RGI4_METVM|nr:quinolinate synthase [Methanocaldococcus vulcanius]ACX72686.1 quinolinate synthetase complex, A subunit [Methanocaldococcus vulcanius M7]
MKIEERIKKLKEEKNAVILAHNYQPKEIQKIADFLGDSLELCIKAKETDADIIVFCGVDFMGESAKILNPEKKVLIPEIEGTQCPMAHQLPPEIIKQYRKLYPEAPLVVYVNTTAETKALADITCTSANADKIVNSLKEDLVLFGPDNNLAYFVKKRTEKKVIAIPEGGGCYVHKKFTLDDLKKLKRKYPNAKVLIHPECNPELQDHADHIASTSGILKIVLNSEDEEFIIGTEVGMINRLEIELEKIGKKKKLIPLRKDAICNEMKKITLEKLEKCLLEEKYEIKLDKEVIKKAKIAIEKMLEVK